VRFNGVWRNGETAVNTQRKKATLASLGLDWRGAGAPASRPTCTARKTASRA
jgi:tonB-dependent siderophore receptor